MERFSTSAKISALPGRAQLEAHALALADPASAGAAPTPALDGANELAQWRVALARTELLASFGLQEREAEVTVLSFGAGPSVALCGPGGEPLALDCELETLEDTRLLIELSTRELVVTGDAGQLWALARLVERHGVKLDARALVVDQLPVLPAAASRLHERFGALVGEGLRAKDGGWLAIAPKRGELLIRIRPAESLGVLGRNGERIAPGQWGLVEAWRAGPDGAMAAAPVWGREQASRAGQPGLELGVSATPLGSSERPDLQTGDLHDLLTTLPVFAYQVRFSPDGTFSMKISLVPGCDRAEAEATILAAIELGVAAEAVTFVEPGVELPGRRVIDERGGHAGRVVVVWAGEPGSEARRAAWREAMTGGAAGVERIRLVDARTGEEVEGVAGEVAVELRSERARASEMFWTGEVEGVVAVGDPSAESSVEAEGWISLLDGDDEHEPVLIAGVERARVGHVQALFATGEVAPELASAFLDGVDLQPYSRPTLARGRTGLEDLRTLWVDDARCVGAGDCARICPTNAIELRGEPLRPVIDDAACIRCQLCCERCETGALRPLTNDDAGIPGPLLMREAELVRSVRRRARPRALTGKLVEPPADLDPRADAAGSGPGTAAAAGAPAVVRRKPSVVLGLATVTLMEHAAALLVDGELVSAVEEERLARDRHYTWRHPERPGTSLSSDACLRLEESWPPRAIDAVLRTAGLTMDEVDLVAVNGIPARYRESFVGGGGWRPPPVLRANGIVHVPHHMSHAACVYGLSDFDDAWILSIDGRGDYETATIWRAEGHELEVVDAVPWLPDCSFGGVYETVTRVLGFGGHGQGSTMALAALGEPTIDLSACMSLNHDHEPVLSEWATEKLFERYARAYDEPIRDEHRDLAASIQLALETTVGGYLARHAGADLRDQRLALCGGVALNCRMNGTLRDRFSPADMYVPPGANDAGTAIGAAVIGHRELTGELPRLGLGHTHLGPSWSDDAIVRALERMRVPFTRMRDVGGQTAELLAAGKIICWFQGPMEFGPRALGGRSIIADPRDEALKARLNLMKSREAWRPFGSSVLAGRQGQWFVQDWDSRFMLFAVDVRPDKRDQIPVVVHADGSTRPQVVHAEHHPRYHAMIAAFEQRTGVPMVVNTSFNRGGEAIVCNPVEAMRSFVGLGADAIVLGDCLVRREQLRRVGRR
ncbi:carbamoyltransferase C-terminal domain-containing protein [Enhygromyxa salina]|uniref:carbamoyltransferase C-terminal domain-containing protein n=1 Tax=Enhygromyxa salina TaxID=215803 RepID=UPI0015E5F863|nr:carbamoyltransferase C-terminal domain-containing protein [Enhygromyxa salina]